MMTAERLKGSLLQMAMQGKLVEQRSEEGTGNELLRGVRRSNTIDSDTQENLIEIPDNWCWVQLGDFCELYTGNSISESVKKAKYMKDIEGYPYIATKDVQFDNSVDYSNGVIIPYEEEFRHAYKGSVLMCIEGGSAGRKIALIDRDVCFGNKLCMFNSSIAYNRFVYYFLQSPVFKNGFKDGITGIIGGVSIKKLKKMWMPLPPLKEQKRIVTQIEELMPFVEQYETASTKINMLNTMFPDLMKKSILQEAVQGKLVPQDPNDEPASDLLKRIAEEKQRLVKEGKIKKQKALPEITEDEIPFDIPDSWKWVRLIDILMEKPTNGYSPKGVDYKTDYKNLTLTAATSGVFNPNAFKYVDISPEKAVSYYLKKDDILVERSNSPEYVGISCLYDQEDDEYIYPDLIMRMHLLNGMIPKYVVTVLQSPFVRKYFKTNASGSSKSMPKINQQVVSATLIPIPPQEEQNRIVLELDKLLPQLQRLETAR